MSSNSQPVNPDSVVAELEAARRELDLHKRALLDHQTRLADERARAEEAAISHTDLMAELIDDHKKTAAELATERARAEEQRERAMKAETDAAEQRDRVEGAEAIIESVMTFKDAQLELAREATAKAEEKLAAANARTEEAERLLRAKEVEIRQAHEAAGEATREAESALAHRNQLQADLEAEWAGRAELRKRFGALDNETMGAFIERLAATNARAARLEQPHKALLLLAKRVAGDGKVSASTTEAYRDLRELEKQCERVETLSAAPQASTEQPGNGPFTPRKDPVTGERIYEQASTEQGDDDNDDDEERDPVNGQLVSARAGGSPIPQVALASGECAYEDCPNAPMLGSRRCYDHQPQRCPEPTQPKPPEPLTVELAELFAEHDSVAAALYALMPNCEAKRLAERGTSVTLRILRKLADRLEGK